MVFNGSMTLADYLSRQPNTTHRDFAERLDVSQVTVTRYATRKRIPRPTHLIKIYEITGGLVTPNDFFDLPDTSKEAAV